MSAAQEMLPPPRSRGASSWQRALQPLLSYTKEDRFHVPRPAACITGVQSSETAVQIS